MKPAFGGKRHWVSNKLSLVILKEVKRSEESYHLLLTRFLIPRNDKL